MLDIKKIIENPTLVIEKLNTRGENYDQNITDLISSYKKFVLSSQEEDKLRTQLNILTKEISESNNNDNIKKASVISNNIKVVSNNTKKFHDEYINVMLTIPNIPSKLTPIGDDEKNNIVIETSAVDLEKKSLPH
jgi:seryl-tRNA synthetase